MSILSYAGGVRIGVAADCGVIPDPDALVSAIQWAFAELALEADEAGLISRSNPA